MMAYLLPIISIAILAAIGALCGRIYSVFVLIPANLLLAFAVVFASVSLRAEFVSTLLWLIVGSLALQVGYLAALAVPRARRGTIGISDKLDEILRNGPLPARHRRFDDGPARRRALEPGRIDFRD